MPKAIQNGFSSRSAAAFNETAPRSNDGKFGGFLGRFVPAPRVGLVLYAAFVVGWLTVWLRLLPMETMPLYEMMR